MIRSFSLIDLGKILHIENQSFPKSPYNMVTFLNLHLLYPETFLIYTNPAEDQVLGYIIFSPDGHIISIAVHPHYRRKGIGTKLIERAIKNSGTKRVWAEVRRSNKVAQAFYSHLGFEFVDVVKNYYGDEDALIVQCNSTELDSKM